MVGISRKYRCFSLLFLVRKKLFQMIEGGKNQIQEKIRFHETKVSNASISQNVGFSNVGYNAERIFDVSHAKAETDRLILLICRFGNMFNTNVIRLRETNVKNISFLNAREKRQNYDIKCYHQD